MLTPFILSWLWARSSLRKMVFRRTASVGRVQVGETFDERLMLDNLSAMPKLWVQIADGSTLPGHRAGYVASMGGRKRATWRARTDRKSTRLNSSHTVISYAVFCLKKKNTETAYDTNDGP